MKILHTTLIKDFNNASGIVNQMYDEMLAAKLLSHDFEVKIYTQTNLIVNEKYKELFVFEKVKGKNRLEQWFLLRKNYYTWLLSQEEKIDCYLLRYIAYDPLQFIFLSKVSKPVFLVHHTKELEELKLVPKKGYILYLVEKILGKFSINKAYGIISVTNEIINYEKNRINDFNKKSILYPNGINFIEFVSKDCRHNVVPEILFIASYFFSWHGLDILLDSIKHSNANFILHIVGTLNTTDYIQASSDKRIVLHGKLEKKQIESLMERCWVGLGSFALERKNLEEASTLKVREYLSNGIPVYSGYKDIFPIDFLFYKQGKCEISNILEFCYKMREFDRLTVLEISRPYIDKTMLLEKLLISIEATIDAK